MNPRISRRSLMLAALISGMSALPQTASATIVEFQTVMGNFEVNLYDNATPATVANFMNYVNNGAYTNTVIHRSIPGFVVQGGGLTFNAITTVSAATLVNNRIPTDPPVINEPEFSNVAGTIAMARSNNINSATSQWFFNLVDNSAGNAQLDSQNEGFTVFGEVIGNGMDVVNLIEAEQTFNFGGELSNLPLQDYTPPDPFDGTHLIIISAIIVTDTTVDSAGVAGLNPPLNTANNTPPPPPPATGGGGGSFSFFALFGLLLTYRFSRSRRGI
jgi:peptidyl-prolyl cis-trans isomerase A (cyclophilin A)